MKKLILLIMNNYKFLRKIAMVIAILLFSGIIVAMMILFYMVFFKGLPG